MRDFLPHPRLLLMLAMAFGFGASNASAAGVEPSDPPAASPARRAPAIGKTTPGDPLQNLWLVPGLLDPVVYPRTAARFGTADWVLSGLGGGLALYAVIRGPDYTSGPRGGLWFDEDVRDVLAAKDFGTQLAIRDTSDILLGLSLSYAFIGDALINAAWLRKSPDVGAEIALMNMEVLALTLGAQQFTAGFVSRERPYARTCGTDELDRRSYQCTTNDRYVSFFSGHASATFALAAVSCSHHTAIPLSGNKAWISCIMNFTTAAATAAMRVIGDQHYATDVLTGAAIGTSIGLLVPALHYGIGGWTPYHVDGLSSLSILPTPQGFVVSGAFQ